MEAEPGCCENPERHLIRPGRLGECSPEEHMSELRLAGQIRVCKAILILPPSTNTSCLHVLASLQALLVNSEG